MNTVVLSYNRPLKPHSTSYMEYGVHLGLERGEEEKAAGKQQNRVLLQDSATPEVQQADLVVMYTGHNMGHLRTDLRALKEQGVPATKVMIVTCTCDLVEKAKIIEEEAFQESETYGAECGGADTMGELVQNFQYSCTKPKDFFEFRRRRALWATDP